MRPRRAEFAVLGLLLVPPHSARGQAIGQGFDLERAGQYQRAATVYFTTLRGEPTNLAALLGLERVLPSLSRLPDLLPAAQRAVAASPRNAALRALLLRTYVALNESDSARAVAQRWTAEQPRDEAPYREWAIALEDAHRFEEARQVFLFGRRALGRPGVFGIELGELLERVGEWEGAAREWAAALSEAPAQLPSATSSLAEAPAEQRERIVRAVLAVDSKPLERRLAAELLLGWGQPERAWSVFAPTVAEPSSDAATALRRFADLANSGNTPDARRVRALALARYADMVPEPLAVRARAEAARAFLGAGDRVAARRVLAQVAADSTAPPDAQALAQSALVEALIDDGQLSEAATRLGAESRLSEDDRAALLLLARGDSARAVQSLRLAAARLETRGSGGEGRADILLLAGRVAVRLDALQQQTALTLFAEVAGTPGKSAAAPAAELEWARLLLRQLKTAEAIAHLEHLILAYPESAVVPEARRELERAKGAIPKS